MESGTISNFLQRQVWNLGIINSTLLTHIPHAKTDYKQTIN